MEAGGTTVGEWAVGTCGQAREGHGEGEGLGQRDQPLALVGGRRELGSDLAEWRPHHAWEVTPV